MMFVIQLPLEYQKVIKTYLSTYLWDSSDGSDSSDSSESSESSDSSDSSDSSESSESSNSTEQKTYLFKKLFSQKKNYKKIKLKI